MSAPIHVEGAHTKMKNHMQSESVLWGAEVNTQSACV
jgi:hypothetical protein